MRDRQEIFPAQIGFYLFKRPLPRRPVGRAGVKPAQIASAPAAQRQSPGKAAFPKFRPQTVSAFAPPSLYKTPHGNLRVSVFF